MKLIFVQKNGKCSGNLNGLTRDNNNNYVGKGTDKMIFNYLCDI